MAYVRRTWPVPAVLHLAMVNFSPRRPAVLLPVFARDIFDGDASTLRVIWGAAGCGVFLGTVFPGPSGAMQGWRHGGGGLRHRRGVGGDDFA